MTKYSQDQGVPFLLLIFFASKRNEAKQKQFRFFFALFFETNVLFFRFLSLQLFRFVSLRFLKHRFFALFHIKFFACYEYNCIHCYRYFPSLQFHPLFLQYNCIPYSFCCYVHYCTVQHHPLYSYLLLQQPLFRYFALLIFASVSLRFASN